jgi:hypothetical protein
VSVLPVNGIAVILRIHEKQAFSLVEANGFGSDFTFFSQLAAGQYLHRRIANPVLKLQGQAIRDLIACCAGLHPRDAIGG